MGDYLKNGKKIGTCGEAYYSTLTALEKYVLTHGNIDDAYWYIDPKKSCSFAFPFPEYDGKGVGNISNFHKGERKDFYFDYKLDEGEESFHQDICQSVNPEGSKHAINIFYPCPCSKEGKTSTNFNKNIQTYRLVNQVYHNGTLHITGRCIYCDKGTIYGFDEALKIVGGLLERAKELIKPQNKVLNSGKQIRVKITPEVQQETEYLHEIIKRILATYD